MRGCGKEPRRHRKPGRGCSVAFKPGRKKFRRRRPAFGLIKPVIGCFRALAR